jgi:CheY-like chemotaxis protein
MKLKYKILWIENEQDWVESIEDQIQEYLEDLGFNYEMKLIGKEEKDIAYNDYDLILMDLNLADQPNGAELISKIRELGSYTDVVFYSSMGINELRNKGKEKELEGVYYSGRTPESSFINKVKAVIDSTIKKVQDLSNLRGLVMAEVSELDVKMMDIIKKYYVQNETEELKNTFHKHITKKLEERFKKALEGCEKKEKVCYHKWKNEPIESIIPQMEAAQLAKAVNYLIPADLYSPVRANFFEDYKAEIVDTRNQLAHCASKIEDGKEILITRDGDKTYNDESIKEIRKSILKYSEIFTKLLQ